MRSFTQIALVLVSCAAFAACANQGPISGDMTLDPASCESACDANYDTCSNVCEQNVDNNMCAEECVDALESCKKPCG